MVQAVFARFFRIPFTLYVETTVQPVSLVFSGIVTRTFLLMTHLTPSPVPSFFSGFLFFHLAAQTFPLSLG